MTDPQQPDYRALLKRSLAAIEQLEAKIAGAERAKSEPIAIVGMACRFPGHANDLAGYWSLLARGGDAVTVVPPHRWDAEALFDSDPNAVGRSYTRWGAFIDDVETFDAAFFGISPREAAMLDPQQRLLLELTWEALEHAAIAPSSLAGTRGSVFVGISAHDYSSLFAEEVGTHLGDAYAASGTAHSVASGRLSYVLGLHGPNFAVDTACSSSVVAVHSAVNALRNGETNLALAGGVSLTLSKLGSILTSRARMMSFDGRCKTFDESADGYVRGEGGGMLVLKRLSDAERDGDRILALLRGSAINQDGRSSGLTAPNGTAQEAVIREALANARLQPKDISVVEAHGTGTPLGDPIEMKALGSVFREHTNEAPLLVGSVKTNIGHLEAASGVAGIIKVVLAMQHGVVPPHLHLTTPNHLIPWGTLPVRVPTSPVPWPATAGAPRRAGVSSFGFSGTNSHVILEEAPARPTPSEPRVARPQLLTLSAQTPAALRAQAGRIASVLRASDAPPLADVAYTMAVGRSHLSERLTVVAADDTSMAAQLDDFVAGTEVTAVATGRFTTGSAPEIAFLFSGQGAQYPGMARELYGSEPVFRTALDACIAIADPLLPSPLLPVIMGDEAVRALLDDTAFTQPALFAVEYALAQLWKSWGVEPAVVMGHSVGEYAAACIAGVFSLEDGVRLIAARGRLMSALPRDGAMVAVFATRARVADALRGLEADVDIGASNGPTNTVISGRTAVVDRVLSALAAEGIEFSRLNVSHAFHSPLMDPMLDEFERIAATVTYATPVIGLVSNVTGRMAGAEVATAAYWRRHVRAAVQFTDSIATLHDENIHTFLEIGPAPVLLGMGQRCERADEGVFLASLRKGRSDREALLESAGILHLAGQPLTWSALCDGDAVRVDLPAYPFQRERYWFDTMDVASAPLAIAGRPTGHPLLGTRIASPLKLYESSLSIASTPWLSDHRIYESPLFPVTGFLELAMAAGRNALGAEDVALTNVTLREGLTIPEPGAVTMQVIVTPIEDGTHQVQVFSDTADADEDAGDGSAWRLHLSATVARSDVAAPADGLRTLPAEGGVTRDVPEYYRKLHEQGAYYGPAFRGITSISRSGDQVLGHVRLPDATATDSAAYYVHPALLDSCVQLIGVGLPWADDPRSTDDICVPVGLAAYHVYRPAVTDIWCHVESVRPNATNSSITSDFVLTDAHGAIVARVEGLEMHRVTRAAMQRTNDKPVRPEWMLEVDWVASPLETTVIPATGKWLVVTDGDPLVEGVATHLGSRGATVLVATHGTAFAATATGWTLDLTDAAQCARLFAEAAAHTAGAWQGIVWMVGVQPVSVTDDEAALRRAHDLRIAALLAMMPPVLETGARLSIVTHGTQAVGDVVPGLADAPIWGLANVIASEYPAARVTRIDLDTATRKDDAEVLATALTIGDTEDRVALRGGQRFVARLTQGTLTNADAVAPRRLEIMERGILENLQLNTVPREAPGAGEVEIRVYATGLNFRDVLNALGMYPGDPGPLGNECAGVITAVGEGVDDLFVGDEVVTMIDRSFATYVLAPAMQTVRKPANLSFVEAATIPVTFLTAEYALNHLAGMKAGDKVLLHAATGGVGMAAIQLARRAGAEIFGTAGSPAKRAMARALGCDHLSDSRSLVFADDFDRITNGEGVDIVLNSLAGDFIPASLRLLKRGGHFIEIGKTGIWDTETVAQSFPGVSYHPLYLGEVTAAEPAFIRAMLQRLMDDFERGVLTPLPQRVYPLERAEEAFRFMGQGLHTGKLVITQHRTPEVRDDASYLITGGLGGLGMACAQWLAGLGARSLVLLGRRAPTAEVEQKLDALRASGVTVTAMACDIAVAADVAGVLDRIASTLPPLRGILHAAGVVDDGMLPEQTLERFDRVMAPKVSGTWHLHHLTRGLPIDFMVLFSSGAALLGSPGQGNYAAANSFMDAMASVRRAEGRHAVSINWGSWSDVGMAADVGEAHRRRWAAQGLHMIAPAEGVRMLQNILQRSQSATVAALPLDRARLPKNLGLFYERLLVDDTKAAVRSQAATVDIQRQLREAMPDVRHALLRTFLTEQVSRVLAIPVSRVQHDQSLMDIGMDSLTAMELRNRVQGAVKIRLSVADLLQGPTISELTSRILDEMEGGGTAPVASAAPAATWEEGSL